MALIPVEQARELVLAEARPLACERAPLHDAFGRVLTEDLSARRTQPPEAVSAMDGYAVRAADVAAAPVTLTVIGEVAAGRVFDGAIGPGETARIFTGGVLPKGADAIVIQENTERTGDRVTVQKSSVRNEHVRSRGLDFAEGEIILRKGARLSARDLSLAAAMNHAELPVHRRPKVVILATGDELVPPGTIPGPGQIVSSNSYALAAMAKGEGAEVSDLGIVNDTLVSTIAALRRAREVGADILVTTGGASVGDYDLVQEALKHEGVDLSFWKVALRPGKPLMHARMHGVHVLGLPGNPVSTYVCGLLFLVPLIRTMSGRTDLGPDVNFAILGCDMRTGDQRTSYMRARLELKPQGLVATPFDIQDSSMIKPLAQAQCLLIWPAHAPAAKAGEPCQIIKLGL